MKDNRPATSAWPIALYVGGLALLLLGQRVLVSTDTWRTIVSIIGAFAVLASAVLRFVRSARAEGERRSIERGLGLLGLVGFVAVLVMLATTESFSRTLGIADLDTATRARIEGIATVGWILLLIIATLPLGFAETALFPMRHAKRIEARRVLSASLAGLTLAFAASYGALLTYVAGKLDVKIDFSYFRTARPGESTIKIAAALTEPVKVLTFFPQLSETGLEVNGYLEDLAKHAPQLQIENHDRVLSPGVARDNRVSQDGVIVLRRDKIRETIFIGTDMSQARSRLRSLDGDFQKALLKLVRERRIAYLTTGHGELNEADQAPDLRLANGVRRVLEAQGFVVKDLGLAQGLATDVPEDATMVLVLGPAQPFLPAEIESLDRYAKRGGHLLLALDPEAGVDHTDLAKIAGLSWRTTLLANDKVHVRRRFNESDRTVLATHQYSAHASVTTLGRAGRRAPIVLPGASALEKLDDADSALHVDFAVRSLPDTFDDRNGNYRFDGGDEKRATYNLAAAVTRKIENSDKEMRIFALGDVDALSDWALGNEANGVFLIDILRWLAGEESFAGSIANTEDVRIEHTKQEDVVWFYSTILGVPSLVLGLGLVYVRRSRKRSSKPKQPAPAAEENKDARRAA